MTHHRKANASGRSTSIATGRNGRKERIDGPFVARTLEMMESPAWQALTHASKLVIERLEIEHLHHGGRENGHLPCTHRDFIDRGVRAAEVTQAVELAVRLGFVERTHNGLRRSGDYPGRAAQFRLTTAQPERNTAAQPLRKTGSP